MHMYTVFMKRQDVMGNLPSTRSEPLVCRYLRPAAKTFVA